MREHVPVGRGHARRCRARPRQPLRRLATSTLRELAVLLLLLVHPRAAKRRTAAAQLRRCSPSIPLPGGPRAEHRTGSDLSTWSIDRLLRGAVERMCGRSAFGAPPPPRRRFGVFTLARCSHLVPALFRTELDDGSDGGPRKGRRAQRPPSAERVVRETRRQRLEASPAPRPRTQRRIPEAVDGSPSASRRRQTKAAKAKGNRTNRKFQRRLPEDAGTGEEGVDFDTCKDGNTTRASRSRAEQPPRPAAHSRRRKRRGAVGARSREPGVPPHRCNQT